MQTSHARCKVKHQEVKAQSYKETSHTKSTPNPQLVSIDDGRKVREKVTKQTRLQRGMRQRCFAASSFRLRTAPCAAPQSPTKSLFPCYGPERYLIV